VPGNLRQGFRTISGAAVAGDLVKKGVQVEKGMPAGQACGGGDGGGDVVGGDAEGSGGAVQNTKTLHIWQLLGHDSAI